MTDVLYVAVIVTFVSCALIWHATRRLKGELTLDIAIGDVFVVNGVVLEVVDACEGVYHLNNGDVDFYFTTEQLAQHQRVSL